MAIFTFERNRLMRDIDPVEPSFTENSEDWKDTIPEEEDDISSEEMFRSFPLEFSDIPDPYPAIPNFGVLDLSIPRAVSPIVCDLFILTPRRFPSRPGNLSDPEHDAHLDKVDAELKAEVEGHPTQPLDSVNHAVARPLTINLPFDTNCGIRVGISGLKGRDPPSSP
jgi:hypothetical protein